jgi:uncharacterized protein (DUF433 family)
MTSSEVLGRGVYSPAEAAHLIGVDTATISRWAFGYRDYPGIVDPDLPQLTHRALSFLTLMELRLMASFKAAGVRPDRFRVAVGEVARRENISHPFAFKDLGRFMRHDGKDFFYRCGDDWEQLTGGNRGNFTWDETVAPYLREVEFKDEYARRWFPSGADRVVVLDPAVQLGTPVIAGTRISTANIVSMTAAGDPASLVARCYGLSVGQVEAAQRFEERLKKAA